METIYANDFFGEQNERYAKMTSSPIDPESIAKQIAELYGSMKTNSRQNQRSEKVNDLVSVVKPNPNLTISPDNINLKEGNIDDLKVDFFSEKSSREKLIPSYNHRKTSKAEKPKNNKKELQVFEELPEDLKYYDECYLKMANLASLHGIVSELFEPNYALNSYYFLTISDSPGYASYIINYCIKNMTSHVPVGWYHPATEQKRELDMAKFCECSNIPQDDFELNLRVGDKFEFSDLESLKQIITPIIENTENEEGIGLMLSSHTSQYLVIKLKIKLSSQKTLQLKEKEMQRHIFKDIVTALYLLADKGHLIIKIYSVFQRMSVELIFLLYVLFEELRVVRLNMTGQTKLERFAICTKFKQSVGKQIREKLASMLPRICSEDFMETDFGLINAKIVTGSRDFIKFVDGMNKIFMNKLIEKFKQPKTGKSEAISSRQTKRLLVKWKLIEGNEADFSDPEDRPTRGRGGYNNYNRGGGGRHNYNRNYDSKERNREDDRDSSPRQYNNRGNYRNRNYNNDRPRNRNDHDNDRPRYRNDRNGNDDDRRRDRHDDNRRGHRRSNDDRDRSRNYDRNPHNNRNVNPEKIEVRQKDILNKEITVPSFSVTSFLGIGGGGGGSSSKKGKEK